MAGRQPKSDYDGFLRKASEFVDYMKTLRLEGTIPRVAGIITPLGYESGGKADRGVRSAQFIIQADPVAGKAPDDEWKIMDAISNHILKSRGFRLRGIMSLGQTFNGDGDNYFEYIVEVFFGDGK